MGLGWNINCTDPHHHQPWLLWVNILPCHLSSAALYQHDIIYRAATSQTCCWFLSAGSELDPLRIGHPATSPATRPGTGKLDQVDIQYDLYSPHIYISIILYLHVYSHAGSTQCPGEAATHCLRVTQAALQRVTSASRCHETRSNTSSCWPGQLSYHTSH